jgi:hypothetical protein
MSTKILNILILCISVLSACKGEVVNDSYPIDAITIERIEQLIEGTTKVFYSSMLETIYYCPGVNLVEKKDKFIISFIRCPIKEVCSVTNPVITNDGNEYIVIKHGTKPIFIRYKDSLVPLKQTKS